MATVRFSDLLKHTITERAGKVFKPRIKEAEEAIDPSWAGRIYDGMFHEHIHLMGTAPNGLFRTHDKMHLQGVTSLGKRNIGVSLLLSVARPFPYLISKELAGVSVDSNNYTYGGLPEPTITLHSNDVRWASLVPEYTAYVERIETLKAEQAAFVAGVKKIVETYTTLGQALKAWPPIWDLLPTEVQEKHNEEHKRAEKAEVQLGLDLNTMTSVVVADKITRK